VTARVASTVPGMRDRSSVLAGEVREQTEMEAVRGSF
jgi:hypothetical protein